MRKGIISALIGIGLFIGGCQTIDPNVDSNDQAFPAYVQKAKDDTKSASIIGAGTLLLTTDAENRSEIALEINRIASNVKQALEQDRITVPGIRQYALDLVLNSDEEDRETTGLILNTVVSVVESHLKFRFDDVSLEVRNSVTKELALSAIDGVLQVTQPYVR